MLLIAFYVKILCVHLTKLECRDIVNSGTPNFTRGVLKHE